MWTGVGQKANDSLADIFDKTTYSEYESCPRDVSCDGERDITHTEEGEEEEMGEDEEVEGDHDTDAFSFTFSHFVVCCL